MAKYDKADLERRMKGAVESLKGDLAGLRTGRANTALLDPIVVEVYGAHMPLNQVATVSAPEPRLITIVPWEKNMLAPIEKAILKSDLGLNPNNDGTMIRLEIPQLTEERRKDLSKKGTFLLKKRLVIKGLVKIISYLCPLKNKFIICCAS